MRDMWEFALRGIRGLLADPYTKSFLFGCAMAFVASLMIYLILGISPQAVIALYLIAVAIALLIYRYIIQSISDL